MRSKLGVEYAAALFAAGLAIVALWGSRNLELGSVQEIGPGFFPIILALILLVLSIAHFVVSKLSSTEQNSFVWAARPLNLLGIVGALVVFALTIKGTDLGAFTLPALGVTGATPLAVLISGFASQETNWKQLAVLAIVLTVFCTLLFRFTLGLPLPVAPWLIGY